MRQNIEIKAICRNLNKTRQRVEAIATEYAGVDRQTDTYFKTKKGRLKLRESTLQGAYLIPYLREDNSGPKLSRYCKIPVEDAPSVKILFGELLGIHKIIRKKREVYLYENVRIHLDEVEGLGSFIELEAVFDDRNSSPEIEQKKVELLMVKLGIDKKDLLKNSYENL